MKKLSVWLIVVVLSLGLFASAIDAGTFGSGIKLVQRGTKTVASTSDTVTVTEVNMDKSFLTSSWSASSGSLSYFVPTVVLTNSTTLTFTVGAAVQDAIISWEVVEYF